MTDPQPDSPPLKTYAVQWLATASAVVHVEATDRDDAIEKADEAFQEPRLCAQCSGWGRSKGDPPAMDVGEFQPDDSEDGVWEVSS